MPDVSDQLINLLLRELLFESRHLAAAVVDGIEQPLVGNVVLPAGVGKISRMLKLAANSSPAPVRAMTLRALGIVNSFCVVR